MGKTPLKPKWTNCIFCNNLINCSRKHDLETHINIHTKERPYDCNLCDQAFNSSSRRSNHHNIVHLGVKFKCDRCEKIFNRVNTFRGHRKKVHGVKPEKGQKKIMIPGSSMVIPDKPPVPGPAPVPVQPSKKESQEKSGVSKKPSSTPILQPLETETQPQSISTATILVNRPEKHVTFSAPILKPQIVPSNSQLPEHDTTSNSIGASKFQATLPLPAATCAQGPVVVPEPVPAQAPEEASQEHPCTSRKTRKAAKKDDGFYREDDNEEEVEMEGHLNTKPNEKSDLETDKDSSSEDEAVPDSTPEEALSSESGDASPPTSPLPHLMTTPPQFDMTPMLVGLKKQYDLIQERNGKRWDPGFFLHMNHYTPDKPVETRAEERRPEVNKITKRSNDSVQIGQNEIKRGRPPKNTENASLDDLAEVQSSAKKQRLDGTQLKCPQCPKVFSQKSHLVKHIGQYHRLDRNIGTPGVKHNSNLLEQDHLSCPFCEKKSEDKDSLEKHLQDNHNDEMQGTNKADM